MEAKPNTLKALDVLSALLLIFATWMAFFYAPMEAVMGNVQRVFYFHVATGWAGMVGYLVAFVAAIAYLRTGRQKWDIIGVASVEIGLVFSFINIATGSIWARPIWNTWWTWDPRLVTATVMELVYLAYLMLRQGIEDPDRRARFGAVYTILGFASVPLTFFSIRIWRTIHPVVIGSGDPGAEGSFDMTPKMLQTFLFSLLTFTVLGIDLLWHRIRLGKLGERIETLKLKVLA
jgi:heme exporter protein C